jgi:hypothetical protein
MRLYPCHIVFIVTSISGHCHVADKLFLYYALGRDEEGQRGSSHWLGRVTVVDDHLIAIQSAKMMSGVIIYNKLKHVYVVQPM